MADEKPREKEWITCRKCGDEVEMTKGKTRCWECIEESSQPMGPEE